MTKLRSRALQLAREDVKASLRAQSIKIAWVTADQIRSMTKTLVDTDPAYLFLAQEEQA